MSTDKRRWWRWFKLPLLLLVALLGWVGWLLWQGNYHEVRPGVLYRSGQLTDEQLVRRIEENGIRSIVNLRGPAPGAGWYETERATAAERGVTHADFDLNSGQALTDTQLHELVALLRRQPQPVLIHCLGGADRTGMASALYLRTVLNEPAAEAADQMTVRYGHFPYLFRRKVAAMDESYWRYVNELAPQDNR